VLLQATKNKTFTSKNTCSSASKDRSHREYLAKTILRRTTKEQFKLKYKSKEQTLV
jgi:hypothetical protein